MVYIELSCRLRKINGYKREVRFEIFAAVNMNVIVLFDMTPYSLVEVLEVRASSFFIVE